MAKKRRGWRKPKPVKLTFFKWAGRWGPFKIKIPCGECALTEDVIQDTLENELADIPVQFETHDWLSNWWKPLIRGGWHAPIVMVEKKVIAQGDALNRGVLAENIVRRHAERFPVEGNHLFGKNNCPHCNRATEYLEDSGVDFIYHDVVHNPGALYEMLARAKPIIGEKTPITVPQIWINGDYVGGADELAEILGCDVEPNPERGQSSISPGSLKRKKAA